VWTETPLCVDPSNGNTETPFACLYTSAIYHGNTGLSFVGTPQSAAMIAASGGRGGLQVSQELGNPFPVPSPVNHQDDLAYIVKELPGKGKGVVAVRNIQRGEVIMIDPPVILLDEKVLDTVSAETRLNFLRESLHRLPEATQRKVLSLARSTDDGEAIDVILNTNGFGMQTYDGSNYVGIMPEISVSFLFS